MALSTRCVAQRGAAAARPVNGAQSMAVVRPVVATRASAKEEALKMAGDLLSKGVDAVKNADKDKLMAQAEQLKGAAMGAVKMSAGTVQTAIDVGLKAWNTYDKNNDGKLSITEAVALLNGPEISAAIEQATGAQHTKRSEADIKAWFDRADFNHDGVLSKREFAAMYAGILTEKAMGNAGVLSNALLSALSTAGGDGKIDLKDLKGLMGLVGLRSK